MFTYCPSCHAIFEVTSGHLEQAGGRTRCSECQQVYQANDYLFDDLDAVHQAVADLQSASGQQVNAASRYAPLDIPEHEEAGWEMTTEAHPASTHLSDGWRYRTISMSDIGSGVAVGLLVLLLGVQWVFFNRDALAAEHAWRPTLERFCETLMCELPMRVDVSAFGIVERDVRKHPTVEDALLINVTFENRAAFQQPYPLFEVSFTDSTGAPVAMRRFSPADYLGEAIEPAPGMPPQTPAQVVLEVIDPGEQAVSFQFDFL